MATRSKPACYGESPAADELTVDERMIGELVDAFYRKARSDALPGPEFNEHIADRALHLERMRAVWSSVTLRSGRYHGRPMENHLSLATDAAHFDRWLTLFAGTADEICPAAAAGVFKDRARRIAKKLRVRTRGALRRDTAKRRAFSRSHLSKMEFDYANSFCDALR